MLLVKNITLCVSIEKTDDFRTWTNRDEINEIIIPREASKLLYRFIFETD